MECCKECINLGNGLLMSCDKCLEEKKKFVYMHKPYVKDLIDELDKNIFEIKIENDSGITSTQVRSR